MRKKLAFFFSLALAVPFGLSLANFNNAPVVAKATGVPGTSVIDGKEYSYMQDGNCRYYDTTEVVPTVEEHFWAPSGYKYDLNMSSEQIDLLLDLGEEVGMDYSYVDIILYYTKFGMEVLIDSFMWDFDGRATCKAWIDDKINNLEPFYEVKESPVETDVSIIMEFVFYCEKFVTEYNSYKYRFEGDVMILEPFDPASCIDYYVQYYEEPDRGERRIDVMCDPIDGFFNEPPYNNPYGFVTDETMQRMSHNEMIEGAKFEFRLYAYETIQIGMMGVGNIEMSYPSHPLPVKLKLTFVSGGEEYSYWSKEFIIGDPGFRVTIDGYMDRTSVLKNSTHFYGVNFNNHNECENLDFQVSATAMPNRLVGGGNVHEFYDRVIGPRDQKDYVLKGSWNDWETDYKYFFTETNEPGKYMVYDVPLASGTEIRVHVDGTYDTYNNYTAPEGCGYYIGGFWDDVVIINSGNYDILFDLEGDENHNHIFLVRATDYNPNVPEFEEKDYYLVGNFNNWETAEGYKLTESNLNYYHIENFEFNAGDAFRIEDEDGNPITNTRNWECSGFELDTTGKMIVTKTGRYDISYKVVSSNNCNIVLHSTVLNEAPSNTEENFVFYVASDNEVRLHAEGRDDEFLNEPAQGEYYSWNKERKEYESYQGVELLDLLVNHDSDTWITDEQLATIPYAGDWRIYLQIAGITDMEWIYFSSQSQELSVVAGEDGDDEILLNVPDEVNLLNGAEKIKIVPSVSSYDPSVNYYFYWSEPSKEGVIEFTESDDGVIDVSTLAPGVTELTIKVECELFSLPPEKTITIRVLDAIFDVAKIQVPNEFHYAGKDLTAAISIRGFTGIQNIDVAWKVTNKAGAEIAENKLVVNNDASITLLRADSDDYTFVAYYEDVKLDTLTVQVRYTDLNKFLKVNVWWIFLMTVGLVVFVILARKIFKRGKTTVENIQRAYDVFCKCLSDDKLTLPELKTIRKEISKCMHRCEDLNIEAFNQYEKSIRYLRKSLADCDNLIKKWDTISVEDKSAFIERLNLDFNKALNVAREIENAKELVEQYHMNANRKNYETIVDDQVGAKGNKSKL